MGREVVDVAVVGAGAAGLTAAMVCAQHDLDTVLIDREGFGGQMINLATIQNFPNPTGEVDGPELAAGMTEQTLAAGAELWQADVTAIRHHEDDFDLEIDGRELRARAVILCSGSHRRRLGLPAEERLHGRGVSFCAGCDGDFFAGQDVVVVGGGDSGLDEALVLASIASSVTVVEASPTVPGAPYLLAQLKDNPRVRFLTDHRLVDIEGDDDVKMVVVQSGEGGERKEVATTGVFVCAGLEPETAMVRSLLQLEPGGHIRTDERMSTSVPGLFAAGDLRQGSARLLIAAAGDGATAAISCVEYLRTRE